MRVFAQLPVDDWTKTAAAAKRAEAAGYDGVSTSALAHDLFMPLAIAASVTERVALNTSIAVAFPRSPMITANIGHDLQTNSGGRFELGLGSQVKGHNERRFSTPWRDPVGRMREYIESMRAIWRCWEKGEKLAFEGEHYRFTLMTPEFSPPPSGLPPIPISIAAVRPAMLKLAGRVCDGVRLHGFATKKYIDEVAMPQIEAGLEKAGRSRESFEVWGGGFVVTGPDDETIAKGREQIRYRIAFYGSTRSYHPVLAVHGWEDLGRKLHEMSKQGRWEDMAAEVSDEVLDTFAVTASYSDLATRVEERFGGVTDSLTLGLGTDVSEGAARGLLQDLQRIETPFRGFPTDG